MIAKVICRLTVFVLSQSGYHTPIELGSTGGVGLGGGIGGVGGGTRGEGGEGPVLH